MMTLGASSKIAQDSVSQTHVGFSMLLSESVATKDRMEEGKEGGPHSSCCCQGTEAAAAVNR